MRSGQQQAHAERVKAEQSMCARLRDSRMIKLSSLQWLAEERNAYRRSWTSFASQNIFLPFRMCHECVPFADTFGSLFLSRGTLIKLIVCIISVTIDTFGRWQQPETIWMPFCRIVGVGLSAQSSGVLNNIWPIKYVPVILRRANRSRTRTKRYQSATAIIAFEDLVVSEWFHCEIV